MKGNNSYELTESKGLIKLYYNSGILKHIQKNQQTFVTGYDFYNTFEHLLYGDKYKEIQNKTNEHDTIKL